MLRLFSIILWNGALDIRESHIRPTWCLWAMDLGNNIKNKMDQTVTNTESGED